MENDRRFREGLDRWITREQPEEEEEERHSGVFVYPVLVGKEEVFVTSVEKGDYPFDTMMEAEAFIMEIMEHAKIPRKEFKICKTEL